MRARAWKRAAGRALFACACSFAAGTLGAGCATGTQSPKTIATPGVAPAPPPSILAPASLADTRRSLGNALRLFFENDAMALNDPSDQFYSQGLRLEWNLPPRYTPGFLEAFAKSLPLFPAEPDEVSLGVFLGQDIYTPSDLSDPNPRPLDRPYAGWLYGGVTLRSLDLDDRGIPNDAIHVLELQTGVVGPSSWADTVQTEMHEFFDFKRPAGWKYQLHDEFGLNLNYTQAHRLLHYDAKEKRIPIEFDVIGNFGGSLGNVHTNASAGVMARLGVNLPRDFGIGTIHLSVGDAGQRSATPFYLFGGVQGRAVARNLFLDGNTWRTSPKVERETLVAKVRGGAVIGLGPLDLSYTFVIETPEFEGTDHHQQFGSVMISYTFR